MVQIGLKIREQLKLQRRSAKWLADNLYCDRTNVYKIFQKESIDTLLLYRISKLLSHDFFKYYSDKLL
ncbi:MAG: XRE family transcriptional regulator [Bacteroidales bacterium]|nr:XRE family transcriptional regulator [Bacteroidales bacterium]